MGDRSFDISVYGATGFVGRQAVAYLQQRARHLRWALAGRSEPRLQAVRESAAATDAGVLVADAQDTAALDQLARRSRVVLSTAGPFALAGSALVAACVRHGTHYVDITGETPWVRQMIDQHHRAAQRSSACVVPGCGFDSVPSDLGSWLVVRALRERFGEACVHVKACFTLRGGLNGGTLASLLNAMETGQQAQMADPFLLNPAGSVPADAARHADPIAPHRDTDFGAWLAPFAMGPINTRVVRRSAALLGYGPQFMYQEYQRVGSGAAAAASAAGLSWALLAGQSALRWKPVRRLAAAWAPAPGEGPSVAQMDSGWFRCELVATGERGSAVRGCIAGPGDPGNRATTRFVCEAALLLATRGAEQGGVLTPATALGAAYADRLRAAGMTIEP